MPFVHPLNKYLHTSYGGGGGEEVAMVYRGGKEEKDADTTLSVHHNLAGHQTYTT